MISITLKKVFLISITGQVGSNSIFTYFDGKTTADYTNANFLPKFDYSCPNDVTAARSLQLCGTGNNACIYDYCLTLDETIATNTKMVQAEFQNTVTILGKWGRRGGVKIYCVGLFLHFKSYILAGRKN